MGKKVSRASKKISKNDRKMIKTLIDGIRPKVYITNTSSFKKLVQELTGHNGGTIFAPSSSSLVSRPKTSEEVMAVQGDQEVSNLDTSIDSSFNDSLDSLDQEILLTQDINHVYNQMYFDCTTFEMSSSVDAYGDFKSWLLEF